MFATVQYSLMATSAVFAELKQYKAICLGNRQPHTQTHTDRLVQYPYPHYAPMHSEVNNAATVAALFIM